MNKPSWRSWTVIAGAAALAAAGAVALPASAQTAEVKEKPRMYTYESSWVFPRARWADVDKENAGSNQKILAPALADGTLLGYGDDAALVHTAEGATHDNWWQASSIAGLMKVLDTFHKTGGSATALLGSATKHWDGLYVSRFYNWHAGSLQGAYGHAGTYKLKADAPDNAVEMLSKAVFVPLLEKLLADGTIAEYEIDEEAIHTESPDHFYVYYLTATAAGLDKVNAAIRDAIKANPLIEPALGSMVDFTPHRDSLLQSNAVYK